MEFIGVPDIVFLHEVRVFLKPLGCGQLNVFIGIETQPVEKLRILPAVDGIVPQALVLGPKDAVRFGQTVFAGKTNCVREVQILIGRDTMLV